VRHHWVRAPSNIALMKYMGKIDAQKNIPENASLSMTLDSLASWVAVESHPASGHTGSITLLPEAPAASSKLRIPNLSEKGRQKVIRHVEFVRESLAPLLAPYGLEAVSEPVDLVLKSANTFPEASGIASSASSFAAITLASAVAFSKNPEAFEKAFISETSLKHALAKLSRQGSGSSCRSFEGPFVEWEGESAVAAESTLPALRHFVVLISDSPKAVSSSEAHLRVKTSPLWKDRPARVHARLELLKTALKQSDLATIARLTWEESWEMHSLFHTSQPPFSYWRGGSVEALQWFVSQVGGATALDAVGAPSSTNVLPIVTMDAGPNVHVIVPESDGEIWKARLQKQFGAQALLQDRPGTGARIVRPEEVPS